MEHIVQFAVGIDDNAIAQRVEESAEKQIIKDIKQDVMNKIFQSYYRNSDATRKDPLSDFSKGLVESFLNEHKDEILDKAAMHLADKLSRTKAAKEKIQALEV